MLENVEAAISRESNQIKPNIWRNWLSANALMNIYFLWQRNSLHLFISVAMMIFSYKLIWARFAGFVTHVSTLIHKIHILILKYVRIRIRTFVGLIHAINEL